MRTKTRLLIPLVRTLPSKYLRFLFNLPSKLIFFAAFISLLTFVAFAFADISMPKNEESFLHFESFVENMFFDPFKKPFWIYDQLDTSACCKTRVDGGQWLWLSWQSSRFRLQRSADRIQSSAKLILNVHCQLCWKDENKEKRGQEWPI